MTDRENLIELIGQVQYLGGLELALADHLLANGVTIPVRCKDCFANGCCSIQIELDMGDEGYCSKGRKDNR